MAKKPAAAPKTKRAFAKTTKKAAAKKPKAKCTQAAQPVKSEAVPEMPAANRFQPGNRFWEARSSAGPNPIFGNPEDLWRSCVEYFEWVEENPLSEEKVFCAQGILTRTTVAKMRAMTISGLCIFLDIDETTWRGWRSDRSDLIPVIARAERVMHAQKFSGAAADLLNPNIIARDLGLSDKKEVTGKDGKDLIPESKMDDLELARYVAGLLTSAAKQQEAESSE